MSKAKEELNEDSEILPFYLKSKDLLEEAGECFKKDDNIKGNQKLRESFEQLLIGAEKYPDQSFFSLYGLVSIYEHYPEILPAEFIKRMYKVLHTINNLIQNDQQIRDGVEEIHGAENFVERMQAILEAEESDQSDEDSQEEDSQEEEQAEDSENEASESQESEDEDSTSLPATTQVHKNNSSSSSSSSSSSTETGMVFEQHRYFVNGVEVAGPPQFQQPYYPAINGGFVPIYQPVQPVMMAASQGMVIGHVQNGQFIPQTYVNQQPFQQVYSQHQYAQPPAATPLLGVINNPHPHDVGKKDSSCEIM